MCFFKMIDINGFVVGKLSLGIGNYQLFFYYANIRQKRKFFSGIFLDIKKLLSISFSLFRGNNR